MKVRILLTILAICLLAGIIYPICYANTDKIGYETEPYTVTEPKVYVTNYGDHYHNGSCGYLHSSRRAIGLNTAIQDGYDRCSVCNGTPSGTIDVIHTKTVEIDRTEEAKIESIKKTVLITLTISFIGVVILFQCDYYTVKKKDR